MVDSFAGRQAVQIEVQYRGVAIQARQLRAPERRTGDRAERFVIGRIPGADGPDANPDPASGHHVLVQWSGRDFVINVRDDMTGEVQSQAGTVALSAWGTRHRVRDPDRVPSPPRPGCADGHGCEGCRLPVPEQGRIILRQGDLTFVISGTDGTERIGRPPLALKWSEQKYTALTAAALAVIMLVAWFISPEARALSMDRFSPDTRFIAFRIVPPEPPPPTGAGAGESAGGQPAAGQSGAAGKRRPRPRDLRLARPRQLARSDAERAAERLREINSAGILGAFRPDRAGSALGQLLEGGSALGLDPDEVLGALVQAPIGEAYGVGGLGVAGGTGAGGGGTGEGPLGDGRLRTIGVGGGPGDGPGHGRSIGRLASRRPSSTPQFIPGQPTVRGGLDKEIIRRVIRRHMNEIRFCYEQELPRQPDLAGRVAVNFTIVPSGVVAAAVVQSSTLGNPRAENCLLEAVRRWSFPQPAGGGLVIATYPFNFVTAGGP